MFIDYDTGHSKDEVYGGCTLIYVNGNNLFTNLPPLSLSSHSISTDFTNQFHIISPNINTLGTCSVCEVNSCYSQVRAPDAMMT